MLSVPVILLFHSHLPAAAASLGDQTQVAGGTAGSTAPGQRAPTPGSERDSASGPESAGDRGGSSAAPGGDPSASDRATGHGSGGEVVADAQDSSAVPEWAQDNEESGMASWYPASLGTCANLTLAFGTVVTITNVDSGASTTCVVDDRGPYPPGRVIDLAEDVFAKLARPGQGIIRVHLDW